MTPNGVYLVDNWKADPMSDNASVRFTFYHVRPESQSSVPIRNITIWVGIKKIRTEGMAGVFPAGLELAQARLAEILDLELRGVFKEKQVKRKSKFKPLWTKDNSDGD